MELSDPYASLTAHSVHAPSAGAIPVVATIEQVTTTAARCQINVSSEKSAVGSQEALVALAMASIIAPEIDDSDSKRAPLDIVACVDRSGSMQGPKIKLMIEALKLLVAKAGLRSTDRFGLVSFDNQVKEELPLTAMDAAGKTKAAKIVDGLRPGGATNLSGALLQSVDMISSSAAPATGDGVRTRAVLLFTDGHANNGITSTEDMQRATQGAVAGTTTSIFTFGFGSDHNENMLRAIASTASGLYYFVSSVDVIATAFADALGGIMSVVAQNAVLTLEASMSDGVALDKVLGLAYKTTGDAARMVINLGDLYSEDEKDILIELKLPALSVPRDEPMPVMQATLRYFNIANSRMEEATSNLRITRPVAPPATQTPNLKLDEQRNRIRAAEAMENATRLADRGDLDGGRALLEAARKMVGQSDSHNTPLSLGIEAQMVALSDDYQDSARYRSVGSKMSKMRGMALSVQRTTHDAASEGMFAGAAKRKTAMKAAWFS